jgi:hypothetical protein
MFSQRLFMDDVVLGSALHYAVFPISRLNPLG